MLVAPVQEPEEATPTTRSCGPSATITLVQNKVVLQPAKGSASDLPDDFTIDNVGYNPEIYVGDDRTKGGLRVERSPEGRPVKPMFDVNQSA